MSEQLTTTSILSLFQTNKEQRQHFVSDVLSRVFNGEVDPIKIHTQLKCAEDIIKQLTSNDQYRNSVVEAVQHYGTKSVEIHNAKFEVKETGVKYDYSMCEDPVINELLEKQSEIDKKVKDRQKFLQTIPQKGLTVVIEETGETFIVYPPSKSSTTNVSVTLK